MKHQKKAPLSVIAKSAYEDKPTQRYQRIERHTHLCCRLLVTHSRTIYGSPVETLGPYSQYYTSVPYRILFTLLLYLYTRL